MASIQKKNNQYYIVYRIGDKQKWIKGKDTYEETKKYMHEVMYKINSNIVATESAGMTVGKYLDNWFNTYCISNLKLTTYTGYRQHIENYIKPRIGNINIIELKPMDVQNMYYDIIENGRKDSDIPLNPKTVIQTHRILRKALKNAVRLQMIISNPCDYVELPKKKRYTYNVLNENEVKPFIEAFKDTEIYIAVLMAIALGLRRGELLALLWSDIDFRNNTLIIDKSLVCADRTVKIDTTKTEKSNRVLLLSHSLLKLLADEKVSRKALDSDYIVLNLKGKRYNPASFARRYTDIRDRRKLKKIRFHDLRHTNATMMYKSGVKTKVMQERLGHSNISTTLDIYTHLFKEDQEEVINVIDSKIF